MATLRDRATMDLGPAAGQDRSRLAELTELVARSAGPEAFERGVAEVLRLDPTRPLWPQVDSVQRALLLRIVTHRRPAVSLDLLRAASSLADVYEWAQVPGGTEARQPATGAWELSADLVHLRAWRQEDLPRLYQAAISPNHGRLWRMRGATPSFREFASDFAGGTLATLVVATNDDDVAVGSVAAYSPSLENGWVYIGFQGVDERSGIGLMLEGMLLFVTWLFDTWNLRKVCAEISPGLLSELESLGPELLQVEGRLRDHIYQHGSWQDVVILSIRRDHWQELVGSVGELVGIQAAAPGT